MRSVLAALALASLSPAASAHAAEPAELDREAIKEEMSIFMEGVRMCYETRLKEVPTLQGSLTLDFVIQPDGSVTDASVEDDTIGDELLNRCILLGFTLWRFPESSSAVEVVYPISLHGSDFVR